MTQTKEWTYVGNSWSTTTIYDENGHTVCTLELSEDDVTEENQEQKETEQEEIAAFIVRACNSHYELLEALKGLVGWVDQVRDDPAADMVKARAAIAKATPNTEEAKGER